MANVDDTIHNWSLVQGRCRYYHWTSRLLNVFTVDGATDLVNNARYHLTVRTRHTVASRSKRRLCDRESTFIDAEREQLADGRVPEHSVE